MVEEESRGCKDRSYPGYIDDMCGRDYHHMWSQIERMVNSMITIEDIRAATKCGWGGGEWTKGLSPCPFCGGRATLDVPGRLIAMAPSIRCNICPAKMTTRRMDPASIIALVECWGRRVGE